MLILQNKNECRKLDFRFFYVCPMKGDHIWALYSQKEVFYLQGRGRANADFEGLRVIFHSI